MHTIPFHESSSESAKPSRPTITLYPCAIHARSILLIRRRFSDEDLVKLSIVVCPATLDLINSDPHRYRDMFWVELTAAFDEDPIPLRIAMGHHAADRDSAANGSLVQRLKNLDPKMATALANVLISMDESLNLVLPSSTRSSCSKQGVVY